MPDKGRKELFAEHWGQGNNAEKIIGWATTNESQVYKNRSTNLQKSKTTTEKGVQEVFDTALGEEAAQTAHHQKQKTKIKREKKDGLKVENSLPEKDEPIYSRQCQSVAVGTGARGTQKKNKQGEEVGKKPVGKRKK